LRTRASKGVKLKRRSMREKKKEKKNVLIDEAGEKSQGRKGGGKEYGARTRARQA